MSRLTCNGRRLGEALVRSGTPGLGMRRLRICEEVQCGVEHSHPSLRLHRKIDALPQSAARVARGKDVQVPRVAIMPDGTAPHVARKIGKPNR
jgi:hypothetical protein